MNCYKNYHTIVNNIPKDQNVYSSSMDDFAAMDNMLASSQIDIGESSNLAQIAQTYAYNFKEQKYEDYVCILSVIAQCSIDSAKRRFDVSIPDTIKTIKKDMNISQNKYPAFWKEIRRGFNQANINKNLRCPMNYLLTLKAHGSPKRKSIDISEFLIPHELPSNRRKCKKVEQLIEKYSLRKHNSVIQGNNDDGDNMLLRSDFDKLIIDIKNTYISKNYSGLMYWLINRSFVVSSGVKSQRNKIRRVTDKNRSILLKVLYDLNTDVFLSCFVEKKQTPDESVEINSTGNPQENRQKIDVIISDI